MDDKDDTIINSNTDKKNTNERIDNNDRNRVKTKAWPEGTCLVMGVSALRHIIYETRMSRKFNVKV